MAARSLRLPLPSSWFAPILALAVLAAYANGCRGPFVFDDPSSIVANPSIRHLGWGALIPPNAAVTAQGRPLLNLSLALDYAVSGAAVWSYHVTNVAIHLAAALVLYGLVRRTVLLHVASPDNRPAAPRPESATEREASVVGLATALLWSLQPVQTEAVTYVIQRAESLMGLFVLLTLYCFARSVTSAHSARWGGLAIVCGVLGAATKEVAAVAPVLVWLYDRTFVSGGARAAFRRHGWIHFGLAASWLISAWLVLGTGGDRAGAFDFTALRGWWSYWLTQIPALAHYFVLVLWPNPLVFEYGTYWVEHALELLAPGLLLLAVLAGTGWALRRAPAMGFLAVWFFLILAPTSLMPGTTQMIVEHRLYLSLAAPLVALVWAAHRLIGRRATILFVGGAAAFGLLTARRNVDYQRETRLWSDTVAKRPANPLAQLMFAMALDHEGDLTEAASHYRTALRLKPNLALGHDAYGELLYRTGHQAEAAEHYRIAVELQPAFADAHDHLAVALAHAHQYRAALSEHETALRLKPDFPDAHFNLANTLAAVGRPREAIAEYEQALHLKPNFPAAEYNLANTLVDLHQPEAAIAHYRSAIALRPDYSTAYNNLGGAYLDLGRIDDATAAYQAALRIDPNLADARENLGRIQQARNNAGQVQP